MKCTQCPHMVGDSYERDCGFPDCMGGWEEAYRDLRKELDASDAKLLAIVDALKIAFPPARGLDGTFLVPIEKYNAIVSIINEEVVK